MNSKKYSNIISLLVITIFIVVASVIYINKSEKSLKNATGISSGSENYKIIGKDIGSDFVLVNHNGYKVSSAQDRKNGKYVIVFFGFSHCPKMCPEALEKFSEILNEMKDSEREKIKFYFITLDPERDDINRLNEFSKEFSSHINMLTGNADILLNLKESFKVYANKDSNEKENYDINHSGFVYFMNLEGKISSLLNYKDDKDKLLKKIRKLLR